MAEWARWVLFAAGFVLVLGSMLWPYTGTGPRATTYQRAQAELIAALQLQVAAQQREAAALRAHVDAVQMLADEREKTLKIYRSMSQSSAMTQQPDATPRGNP